ncbi:PepSY-associated TM helix domain-containing protein [Phenylobacterium sp.]|jgi:uncharacterized iron-regulated membrane protein|uniref:PepSY-associated TM helix domain-containing protein n=1 Tax=Phenylobacterium sp. TaxID=1871053 RepID=UPI002F93981F
MRTIWVALHRWLGLATAGFLFIAGATGAVISWDHELDGWLNPTLYQAKTAGEARPSLELARELERARPNLQVTFAPLTVEPGEALLLGVEARPDPSTGKALPLGYNQVALDPATGAIQGQRFWGQPSLSRENLLPFLYKLHYSLTLPFVAGLDVGVLLMGLVGLAWTLDCLVALWISFPKASAWRKSFAFRWRDGGYRLTFDLHRSGGVWLWGLLLTLAVTSVSMNLNAQVVRPIVGLFSDLSPDPFSARTARAPDEPALPRVSREQAVALARAEADRRGWDEPPGGVFYSPAYDLYGVGFYRPGNDHGDGGLGNRWLYFDAASGKPAGALTPGEGTAGDIFLQAQFPLHSGRIIGLPGRVLVSLLGVAVAGLSATGVIIWARKRRSRVERERRMAARPAPLGREQTAAP